MAVDPARAKSLFLIASDLSEAAARAAYLDRECGSDADLRARVEALLRAHDAGPLSPTVGDSASAPGAPPETADYGASARAGAVLAGKYKLVEEIGEGGMGRVYMAQQTEPVKRFVAVKLVKAGMDSRAVLARFEAERQALALMDHPNIARVFDAGATPDGLPFFAMELVKGVPITTFCDDHRLTPKERLELFVPVCQAIQHAHQKGVIHRDIKPNNVLVALYDDKPVPKVIDFGVAKATGQPLTDRTLATGFGAVVGTPEYMSPEQAGFNNLDVDTRSDVYALGVLLYELLTGSPPFSRGELYRAGVLEILRVIREQEPARPSTKLSTDAALPSLSASRGTEPAKLTRLLRGELDWIVLKALEKDRNRRYESANGFAADVQRYLAGEPVQAVPPTAGYRLRKWVRRNRVAVAAAAAVWLVTLAQVGFSTAQWLQADDARRAEARERRTAEAARAEAEGQRERAEEQRKLAEYRAAAVAVDAALETVSRGGVREGLVRLAGTLKELPADALALRQGVVANLLVWGQRIAPAYQLPAGRLHAVSPDGRAGLGAPGGSWEARDLVTGKRLARLGDDASTGGPYPTDWSRSGTFSADGRLAATLHAPSSVVDPTVRVWDAATWKERFHLRPAKLTYEVRLNRDGSRLATRSDAASAERTNDPDKMRSIVHLWDGRTGASIATLDHGGVPVEQLDFAPAGDVLVSVSGRVVRLWSAADGRLLHALDRHADFVTLVTFSPSGKTLAVAAGPRVYWWNVADGTPAGPAIGLGFAPQPADQDEVIRFAFETEDVLIVRVWNLHGVSFGRGVGGAVCVRGEAKPFVLDALCSDGRYALTEDRHVYSLAPFRRLTSPPGRKFPPEVLAAARGRRYVQVGREFLDLVAEVPIGGGLNRPEVPVHPVRADGFGFVVEGEWLYGRFSGQVLVPAPAVLPPDDVLELWARVLARGHIDPDSGLFKPDGEEVWERNRRELAARARPAGAFAFPGAFASDPLFWLRRAYREAEDVKEKLPLVERLVAAEPSWQNYRHRAHVYAYTGRGLDAIREDLRARALAKDEFEPDADEHGNGVAGVVHDVLTTPDRPKEEYELALRWLNATGAEAATLRALALYRLGRPADALRVLSTVALPRPTDTIAGLMSPWAALAVGRAQAEARGRDWRGDTIPLVIEALCHQKLGRPEAARRCLAIARELLRDRTHETDLYRGNDGYGAVVDEALRAVPSKE